MTAWFASDLHLDPSTPDIADRFLRFLSGPVRGADALFLLGDLFEAWIGDDDPEPAHCGAVAAIAAALHYFGGDMMHALGRAIHGGQ